MRLAIWVLVVMGAVVPGMLPNGVLPGVEAGLPTTDGPLITAPTFLRVAVGHGEERRVSLTVTAGAPTTLLAAVVDCRCVSLVETTPIALPQGASTLHLRIIGLLPGVKTVIFRTTTGSATLTVQVAVPGASDGMATLASLAKEAAPDHLRAVAIVHDLHGRLTNCGCSTGSLGGIGQLAKLPETLRRAGFSEVRCVLTGAIDGDHSGLGKALGWEVAPTDIAISPTPADELGKPEVLAVIDTSDGITTPAHQKILRPILDGGAVAILLLVDGNGRIRSRHVLPIDRSLPSDPGLATRFPEARTIRINELVAPSNACLSCHTTAHATWSTSAHARAWIDLPVASRVDACVTCHSTAQAGTTVRAPAVQCLACHLGTTAHAALPTTHTTGVTDCRSCHDAAHQPGFDRDISWELIRHGR